MRANAIRIVKASITDFVYSTPCNFISHNEKHSFIKIRSLVEIVVVKPNILDTSTNMQHNGGGEDLTENVEQLRARLEAMKRLMAASEGAKNLSSTEKGSLMDKVEKNHNADSIIDGSFLSVVFGTVLVLIIIVSFYAFQNLYYAVLKKFPSHHTEL